eukprot:CAMPEP_0180654462 /NCGR_PEP_ID=MMETSP1037_2-20121125/54707_1 /TAXON_ID=632150 /ORGANISM="Azadinium spinosum, Strain 3D9" /LENGTH=195 /DNA_ID=CAMNT_0022680731 /DNA_START=63 /DNA_END=647 /DNA_ORIENTATION=+
MFERIQAGPYLPRVIVVGAHYPHYRATGYLAAALARVIKATGENNVVFMADTNLDESSYLIAKEIGIPRAHQSIVIQKYKSCCLNDGFKHRYDRIFTNFGVAMETLSLDMEVPDWAIGEYHKAIVGVTLLDYQATAAFGARSPAELLASAGHGALRSSLPGPLAAGGSEPPGTDLEVDINAGEKLEDKDGGEIRW